MRGTYYGRTHQRIPRIRTPKQDRTPSFGNFHEAIDVVVFTSALPEHPSESLHRERERERELRINPRGRTIVMALSEESVLGIGVGEGCNAFCLGLDAAPQSRSPESNRELGRGEYTGNPLGASTQYLRTLVPNTIEGMAFETRDLKCWVLGPSGLHRWLSIQRVQAP